MYVNTNVNFVPWWNPFVPISTRSRRLLVAYFLLWRILPTIVSGFHLSDQAGEVALSLALLRLLEELLLLLPFLLSRVSGTPIGWLHPLTLPTLVSVGMSFARNPLSVFLPFTVWLAPQEAEFNHAFLGYFSGEDVLELQLREAALILLGHISYLAGFLLYSRRTLARSGAASAPFSTFRISLVVLLCVGVFGVLMEINGGVFAHFSSLAYGRARMALDIGHLLVLIRFLPYILAFWYLLNHNVLYKPWFAAIFGAALLMTFLATGSRSGLFWPLVTMLVAWMSVTGKVPLLRAMLLGLLVFLALGYLGELRGSAAQNRGATSFSAPSEVDLGDIIRSSQQSVAANRSVSGGFAVLRTVPHDVPRLSGITYLGSLLFFVPRTIWPEKPRGAGAYVGALIYEGRDNADGYLGTGYPMSAEIEAFWNFGVFGVAPIFLIFGLFHRLVTRFFLHDPRNPFRAIVFIVTLLSLPDPGSLNFSPYFQTIVLLTITWSFIRVRPRKYIRPIAHNTKPASRE